jgi:hypothetical protein
VSAVHAAASTFLDTWRLFVAFAHQVIRQAVARLIWLLQRVFPSVPSCVSYDLMCVPSVRGLTNEQRHGLASRSAQATEEPKQGTFKPCIRNVAGCDCDKRRDPDNNIDR